MKKIHAIYEQNELKANKNYEGAIKHTKFLVLRAAGSTVLALLKSAETKQNTKSITMTNKAMLWIECNTCISFQT